jgi:hypothetical protein
MKNLRLKVTFLSNITISAEYSELYRNLAELLYIGATSENIQIAVGLKTIIKRFGPNAQEIGRMKDLIEKARQLL